MFENERCIYSVLIRLSMIAWTLIDNICILFVLYKNESANDKNKPSGNYKQLQPRLASL